MESTNTTDTTPAVQLDELESHASLYRASAQGMPVGHVVYSPDLNAWCVLAPGVHDDEDAATQALLASAPLLPATLAPAPATTPAAVGADTDAELDYEPLNGDDNGITFEVSRGGQLIGHVFYDAQEDGWYTLDADEVYLDEGTSYDTRAEAGRWLAAGS